MYELYKYYSCSTLPQNLMNFTVFSYLSLVETF